MLVPAPVPRTIFVAIVFARLIFVFVIVHRSYLRGRVVRRSGRPSVRGPGGLARPSVRSGPALGIYFTPRV